jgi:hypothetical protein
MAEPITKLEELPDNQRRVIEANAGNELIPVSRDASGVITQYRQMSPQEYLTSIGGLTKAGYFGNDIAAGRGMSDEEYFGLLKKGGVELLNATTEARVRAGETEKLLARYKSQGMSDADAQKAVDDFWRKAAESERLGYEIDEYGNTVPLYGSAGSGFFGRPSAAFTSAFGSSTSGINTGRAERQSAYDLLYEQFKQYGLESLVEPLKGLIISGASPSEFTIKLRETDAYKKRFAANEARIKSGLRALSEAEYIRNEDAYQEVMRRRGLPPEYYAKGDMGIQKGFESLLAGDVSSTELEDRIVTAQDRVLNANPEIAATLKQFYPGISNGDILAYALDPTNAINQIKRKITTAEIGTAAKQEGLTTGLTRAEELATMGVTGATAAQGYKTIGGGLQRGSQLASIYGEDAYNQATAEQEVFGLAGAPEARKQRQKITGLEKATFSGQTGLTSGALARDRAGAY